MTFEVVACLVCFTFLFTLLVVDNMLVAPLRRRIEALERCVSFLNKKTIKDLERDVVDAIKSIPVEPTRQWLARTQPKQPPPVPTFKLGTN